MTGYEEERNIDRFEEEKYVIPVKIFGLYWVVVCKSGGKACSGGGVGSDA